ncbi:coproporphyrinogen dehydrogenase [Treponema pallidum subsp. endemicum]|uniref:coproporphyrinogen-III oxidase family protein n=1 Tax=Treponema pallidum TaxID=160 RepID=UPI00101E89E7|nr:coproporphyrinogen-III oxidase family protein [Treponema pallidum]QBC41226.1 coproporphyrinogen dehydrogenase [Treponema pallidum subsp. endemicum]
MVRAAHRAVPFIMSSEVGASLYVHIPFCAQRCAYCDFYSLVRSTYFRPHQPCPHFIDRLLQDVALQRECFGVQGWQTVYMGGGTPSLLAPQDIRHFCVALRAAQRYPIQEFTLEVNPEDVTEGFLCACAEGGVNRLSLGVQSLRDEVLRAERRAASAECARTALRVMTANARFFSGGVRISADLIAGLRGQTARMVREDIDELLSFGLRHVSLYGLCVPHPTETQEERIAALWAHGSAYLVRAGFNRYELSNFARTAADESAHNRAYWRMAPHAGVGPGAVGTRFVNLSLSKEGAWAIRSTVRKHLGQYLAEVCRGNVYEHEFLTEHMCVQEALLMGLRLEQGLDVVTFRARFGKGIEAYIGKTIARWQCHGRMQRTATSLRLSAQARVFLDSFLREAFAELART